MRGGFGEQGLTRARRTVEQYSAARAFAERGVHVRVRHGIDHFYADGVLGGVEAHDVGERYRGESRFRVGGFIARRGALGFGLFGTLGLRERIGYREDAFRAVDPRRFKAVAAKRCELCHVFRGFVVIAFRFAVLTGIVLGLRGFIHGVERELKAVFRHCCSACALSSVASDAMSASTSSSESSCSCISNMARSSSSDLLTEYIGLASESAACS